jgi:hypothetical protein
VIAWAWTLGLLASPPDVPPNLVVDLRIFEARSTAPDFGVMEKLSFFVETDGTGISDAQWLATLARQIPDAFLATLATETVSVDGSIARFTLQKRSRSLELSFDLSNFLERGTYNGTAGVRLSRGDETARSFEKPVELRTGQTYVFASRDLELSASEYVSHFRDFESTEERGQLYETLRQFSFFLVVAVTPRMAEESAEARSQPVQASVAPEEMPVIESPFGIPLTGEIELELALDDGGSPKEAHIVRSSLPEVNSRVLGAAAAFHLPQVAGKNARVVLPLRLEP